MSGAAGLRRSPSAATLIGMATDTNAYTGVIAQEGLTTFEVAVRRTHLLISAERDLTGAAEDLVAQAQWQIESFSGSHPRFIETWAPYDVPVDAPDLVRAMARAASMARVGPMAAIGGVIAEYVAKGLAPLSPEVIVRNRSDAYMLGKLDRTVALRAGKSSLTGRVGMRIPGGLLPLAVCTSFGTVARPEATDRVDAATVMAHDGALADAVATALANRVHTAEDVQRAMDACRGIIGVLGLLVVVDGHLGAWGNMHLTALDQ